MIYGYARVSTDGQSVAVQVSVITLFDGSWRGLFDGLPGMASDAL
jgi:hypothetical protein